MTNSLTNFARAKSVQTLLLKFPIWLAIALLLLATWRLAELSWLMVPNYSTSAPQSQASLQPTQRSISVDINAITQLNLFGVAPVTEPEQVVEQPVATAATRDTSLSLKLSGVVLSTNPALSRAMIQTTSGSQELFAIGDEVANNTELHEIHADHVVLNHNGSLETLRMEKLVQGLAPPEPAGRPTSFPGSVGNPLAASVPISGETVSELRSIREQLIVDPSKASDFLRVRPAYSKGLLTGYRIYPGKNREIFTSAGLRSGDLVTAINGQTLDDPQKGFQILSSLSTASSITLDVLRRGRAEQISVNLE